MYLRQQNGLELHHLNFEFLDAMMVVLRFHGAEAAVCFAVGC
jgi:hypothetical protein